MDDPSAEPSLLLLPEVEARTLLGARVLTLRIARPPYAAVGLGTLRVLRVLDRDGRTEMVAGYDGYERLDGRPSVAG